MSKIRSSPQSYMWIKPWLHIGVSRTLYTNNVPGVVSCRSVDLHDNSGWHDVTVTLAFTAHNFLDKPYFRTQSCWKWVGMKSRCRLAWYVWKHIISPKVETCDKKIDPDRLINGISFAIPIFEYTCSYFMYMYMYTNQRKTGLLSECIWKFINNKIGLSNLRTASFTIQKS